MPAAHLLLTLNAHLPFVRETGREGIPQEQWLYQAVTESYIPLLDVLGALERDHVPTRLTVSISPALLAMLADPALQARYLLHLDGLVEIAETEERRTRNDERVHRLSETYLARFCRARTLFLDEWQRDLVAAFRAYQDAGLVEIIPSAATYGFLPLLAANPAAIRAQIDVAAHEYRRFFSRAPSGFWLPECGYHPGLDVDLARAGFRYFFVDTHGIAHATPRPVYGVYAPIACPSGVVAFGRDPESAKALSASSEAYPSHPSYRAFQHNGLPMPAAPVGLEYRRIDTDEDGELYDPDRAQAQARQHAAAFVEARARQVAWLARTMDRPPVLVASYEAELLGRWWFEGPLWLEHVCRRVAESAVLDATTASDLLARPVAIQQATPAASSWGPGGFNDTWLSGQNGWVYRHLHATTDRLHALCRRYPSAEIRTRRALTQALRELMLAQASDWALLMARRIQSDYAVRRTREHLLRCQQLCSEVEANDIDDLRLSALEDSDNLFPALDYRVLT